MCTLTIFDIFILITLSISVILYICKDGKPFAKKWANDLLGMYIVGAGIVALFLVGKSMIWS